jgi:NADPH-dependent ferric siderophore reductase
MAQPEPRQLDVVAKRQVTPNMLRVTLGGPGMADFPDEQTSGYVKLLVPDAAAGREVVRTYTVRSHRADEIDVDFALHEECGPATLWAMNTAAGDSIMVGGPGPRKLVHPEADWYLLVGDMTALPAISGNLELLPDTAIGTAVIEVMDEADIQDLQKPPHLNIKWVINPRPGHDSAPLDERVRSVQWDARATIGLGGLRIRQHAATA